ncbi:MAG: WD40 repeat domain-containing protein [Chloroflexi bacterium]|nr:MAG: WD40 repeat domain-containing protein [Chloroflexota bacterium]
MLDPAIIGNHWLLKYIGSSVIGVAFSPDGRVLASVGANYRVRLSAVESGHDWWQISGIGVTFSPTGKMMAAVGRDSKAHLWELNQGRELKRVEGPRMRSVVFSHDGQTLAGVTDGSLRDKVMVWNTTDQKPVRKMKGQWYGLQNVAFSPNGELLAGGSKRVRVWHVESGRVLQELAGHTEIIEAISFSPDGRLLATAARNGVIILWNVQTGQVAAQLTGHTNEVHSVAFSPNGQLLASACWDKTIGLWNVESGALLGRLHGHHSYVHCVAFSPDGRFLASGSWDRTVRLWGINVSEDEWQHIARQWQQRLSPGWRKAGRCEQCGDRVRFWNRWRGVRRCSLHRKN